MYYTYEDIIKKYKNDYQLKKAIDRGEINKIKAGLYSDGETLFTVPEAFIKRSDTILTLQSAFYYHNISDYIPKYIYLATPKNAYPIQNPGIKQIFMSNKYHSIGVETGEMGQVTIRVYDLERTLIELIRYETKIPFEEYHHVLNGFRKKRNDLNFNKLMSYVKQFKSYKKIMKVIQYSII